MQAEENKNPELTEDLSELDITPELLQRIESLPDLPFLNREQRRRLSKENQSFYKAVTDYKKESAKELLKKQAYLEVIERVKQITKRLEDENKGEN